MGGSEKRRKKGGYDDDRTPQPSPWRRRGQCVFDEQSDDAQARTDRDEIGNAEQGHPSCMYGAGSPEVSSVFTGATTD